MDGEDHIALRDFCPTPAYVIDMGAIRSNLAILDEVQSRTDASILLALKGFATFSLFPVIRETLRGISASSPHEARLGREEFKRQVHSFAPAYSDEDLEEFISYSDHIIFNSFSQWKKLGPRVLGADRKIECGLRINPEHSEGSVEIYDPCARYSRLGIPRKAFEGESLEGITGLHFHTLCEQNADALERTLDAVEKKFGPFLPQMDWVNFGGGHHITRPDYDIDLLCRLITNFQDRWGVHVFLEPGEAIALNTGFLVAQVLDIVENEMQIAILNTSASAHMPDVIEMPYRPEIVGAGRAMEKPHTYRLGGLTCLAGDIIGDYSFDHPLKPGDRLTFLDMAHYTMVKNTTFNGIRLPHIALYNPENRSIKIIRSFAYEDYRNRLS